MTVDEITPKKRERRNAFGNKEWEKLFQDASVNRDMFDITKMMKSVVLDK